MYQSKKAFIKTKLIIEADQKKKKSDQTYLNNVSPSSGSLLSQ